MNLVGLKEITRLHLGEGRRKMRLIIRDKSFLNVSCIGVVYSDGTTGKPIYLLKQRKDGKNRAVAEWAGYSHPTAKPKVEKAQILTALGKRTAVGYRGSVDLEKAVALRSKGMTYSEVARAIGVSRGETVRNLLLRYAQDTVDVTSRPA